MKTESYNIHNLCSFKLINNLPFSGFLAERNFEYDYFRIKEVDKPNFFINVGKVKSSTEDTVCINNKFFVTHDSLFLNDIYGKCKWDIQIKNFNGPQIEVDINARFKGYRKFFKYAALKNIFVRPLISLHLISKKSALIHSGSVNMDGRAFLFVGRPGVFKTSIVMEFLRNYGGEYLGEENTIIREGMAYSFPLNIKSFEYKMKYFKSENPTNKFQKSQLIKHVLYGKRLNNIPISKPCKIAGVFLIKKGSNFLVEKTGLKKNILADFLENEKLEISMTPTHLLSGVKGNHFNEYLNAYTAVNSKSWLNNVWTDLEDIISESYKNTKIFSVTVPTKFDKNICKGLFKEIIID